MVGVDHWLDVHKLLDDWGVLLIDVDKGETSVVVVLPSRCDVIDCADVGDGECELNSLFLGSQVATIGNHGKRSKYFDAFVVCDVLDVGAGTWNNEVLVQGRKGKVSSTGGQERKGRGKLRLVCLPESTVESILLALLADD